MPSAGWLVAAAAVPAAPVESTVPQWKGGDEEGASNCWSEAPADVFQVPFAAFGGGGGSFLICRFFYFLFSSHYTNYFAFDFLLFKTKRVSKKQFERHL